MSQSMQDAEHGAHGEGSVQYGHYEGQGGGDGPETVEGGHSYESKHAD
jgi:hypothetical protein